MAGRATIVFTLIFHLAALSFANKWEVAWHSSDINLVPPLPIAAPKSVNAQCRHDSVRLIEALGNETLWAEQMWDASAKAPVGIISGSRFQLGDFDECLDVQYPVEAQYCLMDVKIMVPPGHNTTDPHTLYYDPNGSLWDKMYYRGSPFKIRIDEVKWALCVPASCSGQDIVSSIQDHLSSINYTKISVSISPRMCSVKNRYYDQFFTSDIIFCTLMLTLFGLTVLATLYDFSVCADGQKEWKWNTKGRSADLLMCFSARRAVHSMVRRRGEVNNLNFRPLSGITFMAYVLITAGHRWGFRYSGPIQNVIFNESIYYNIFTLMFTNHMDLFVDVFFTISGCVAVFFVLQRMETHKVRFYEVIIVRYFRLTPVYAIVLFFYATLYYKMGDGPLWNSLVGQDVENCKQVWWTNLLYINNYVHADKLCGFHTWFMPCEFQFGVLIIPLCYLYHYKPKVGLKVAYVSLVVALILPFYTTWTEKLNGNLIFNAKFFLAPGEDEYWDKFYMKTWTRAGPYIIGSILGYILHHKSQRLTHSKTWIFGICGSVIMFISWTSGAYIYYPRTEYNRLICSLYGATIRSIWSAGLSLVLYALLNGSQTCVHSILSWRPFSPLAAIGFNVYLLNTILPTATTAALRNNDHISHLKLAMLVFGDLGMDMIFGLLLYLCAEKPFIQLGMNLTKILENKPKQDPANLSQMGYDNKVKVATEHL